MIGSRASKTRVPKLELGNQGNSYTGELGSDGVVLKLKQEAPNSKPGKKGEFVARELKVESFKPAPKTAMRVISGKSHSGKKIGIMRSVKENRGDTESSETVESILLCLQVASKDQYQKLCDRFDAETEAVQKNDGIGWRLDRKMQIKACQGWQLLAKADTPGANLS